VAVFGLGTVGLAVVEAAKKAGASKVVPCAKNHYRVVDMDKMSQTKMSESVQCHNISHNVWTAAVTVIVGGT
jgi:Zn-dependent alcohol dehydrogenase